jgi:glycosyltransferase involved in cell wall biosynthesis
MFSIVVLTKNEEANLEACLACVRWCDDIVVLDSFSTDRTVEVAQSAGVTVVQRAFDDFGSQRNFALKEISFKHPWVFHLDADERFNEELRKECDAVISADQHSAYFVANRIIFLGRWIRRCSQYPFPQVRLVKVGEVTFAKAGHGQREEAVLRGVGHLHQAYDHLNFSKGIGDWVDKHNRYSGEEALLAFEIRGQPLAAKELFSGDSTLRRRAMKRLHARLPARWVVKFLYLYVFRFGFMEGYPGFAYCMLQGFYDLLISVKMLEQRISKNGTLLVENR